MDEKSHNYLELLGMGEALQKRVEDIFKIYTKVFETQVNDIFISEYIDSENKRIFDSLWFFNAEYLMEAKKFVNEDDFDVMRVKNHVVYWQVKKENFDFNEPTDKSRLALYAKNTDDMSGTFKASKENCTQLMYILKKYIYPNLRTP